MINEQNYRYNSLLNLAIKQHPSRHNRTKSIADIADDVNESLLTQRGGIDRRGHYKVDSE